MATTTNYGWTTPDDTALVKDGASAIRALGTAIDTSMNTALGTKKSGLVLLNTTSFSAVTSQSVNDVFSSTYSNYLIIVNSKSDANATSLVMRLRASGSDNSSGVYGAAAIYQNSAGSSAFVATGTTNTSWDIGYITAALYSTTEITINRPFDTIPTNAMAYNMRSESAANGTTEFRSGGYSHGANYSATGFTLIWAQNCTGNVRTYGYNN